MCLPPWQIYASDRSPTFLGNRRCGAYHRIPNTNRIEGDAFHVAFLAAHFPVKWYGTVSNHRSLVSWILFTLGLFTSTTWQFRMWYLYLWYEISVFLFPLMCLFSNSNPHSTVTSLLCCENNLYFSKISPNNFNYTWFSLFLIHFGISKKVRKVTESKG